MQKILLTLIVVLIFLPSRAQQDDSFEACGYYGDTAIFTKDQICEYFGFTSNNEAEEKVNDIMNQIGLQPNFIVMPCPRLRNAFAVNLEGDIGQLRYIIYDNAFLERIDLNTNTDWAAVSILAHEIGHHLNGHTLDKVGSRPAKELESDEFSGFALFKLGASLEEAQAAMKEIAGNKTSKTHPAKADRLTAIENGWKNAEVLTPKYKTLNRNADYTTFAKKWFVKAFEIDGNTKDDHVKRVAYYGKATEYKADYVAAYRNRAKYLNVLGLYKEAIKDANRAISIDKNQWNAYTEKATSYFGLGEYQKSVDLFSIAIDNGEKSSPYDYAGRGWAYFRLGKNEEATSDLEMALKLKPGWKDAKKKLERVSGG